MALPDHFEGEDVIITFEREETGVITNVDGKILSFNLGGGEAETDEVYTFGNKTFNFQKPRAKFTIECECIVNSSLFDMVHLGAPSTTTPEARSNRLIKSSATTNQWRVIFWFQSATYHKKNATKTIIVPSKAQSVYRVICVDVKAVSFEKEFTADDYMKGTLNLEFSATSSEGYANFIEQEGIHTGGTTSTILTVMTGTAVDTGGNTGLLLEARGYLTWNTTTPAWTAGTTTTRYRYAG